MTKEKFALCFVLLLAFGAGLTFMGRHDFWQVEAGHLILSQVPVGELKETLHDQGMRPPLYYLLLKAWSLVFHGETGLRLLSLLFVVGAVWITFKAASLLFCWKTGFVTAVLCAASPLWTASAGVMVAPYGLDLLLCALLLHSFCLLLIAPAWKWALYHGLVLAAAAYAHPLLCMLVPAEGIFLAIYFRQLLKVWPKWICAVLLLAVVILPWMPVASHQRDLRSSPDDSAWQGLGMRVSAFMIETSLGRLHAWYPRAPVISLTPSALENETLKKHRPDMEGDDLLAGGMQALQMIFLAWYVIFAIVGMLAAMKVSAWPLPKYIRARQHALEAINRIREARGQSVTRVDTGAGRIVPRQSAVLLVLGFVLTLILAVIADLALDWKFINAELVFLTIPFYIMVARGIGTLEWRVMFYGAILVILCLSLIFSFLSESSAPVSNGIEEAVAYIDNQIQSGVGDVVVHANPITYMPARCYQPGFGVPEIVFRGAPTGSGIPLPGIPWGGLDRFEGRTWIWWIEPAQKEGSTLQGCSAFLGTLFTGADPAVDLSISSSRKAWKTEESRTFENVTVRLFIQQKNGA